MFLRGIDLSRTSDWQFSLASSQHDLHWSFKYTSTGQWEGRQLKFIDGNVVLKLRNEHRSCAIFFPGISYVSTKRCFQSVARSSNLPNDAQTLNVQVPLATS